MHMPEFRLFRYNTAEYANDYTTFHNGWITRN